MSQENVELVRSIYEPWGRGDFRSVEWAHPEIEFVIADLGPASGSWTGLAAMAEAWRAFLGAWEEYRTEVDEYRELDGERVLVLLHLSGRGKTSGVELGEMRTKAANLFHVRGGKVTRLVLYAGPRARPRRARPVGARRSRRLLSLRDTARAMSQENVETSHRFTEALVRGDYAAAAAELGPRVEIDDTDIPESTGTDSFYAWLARWDEAWEAWRIEDLEVRAAGEDRTDLPLQNDRERQGKRDRACPRRRRCRRLSRRQDRANRLLQRPSQALEAVGLAEQDTSTGT